MNVEDLAKSCGATFYRHRTSPHEAAVAFGPAAWEKFCKELNDRPRAKKGSWEDVFGHLGTPEEVANEWIAMRDKINAMQTILLDPSCAERGCICHDARDGTVEAVLKGGKTGWPPGLLQDDNSKLSKWFASRLDARYVLRSVLIQPFDDHETITFHKLEDKS